VRIGKPSLISTQRRLFHRVGLDELSGIHERQSHHDVEAIRGALAADDASSDRAMENPIPRSGDTRLEKARRRTRIGNAQPWNVLRRHRLVRGSNSSAARGMTAGSGSRPTCWRAGWDWGRLGSPWFVRWLGPIFRIGRNPILRLCFGCKISDIGSGAMSGSYSHGPATTLDHF